LKTINNILIKEMRASTHMWTKFKAQVIGYLCLSGVPLYFQVAHYLERYGMIWYLLILYRIISLPTDVEIVEFYIYTFNMISYLINKYGIILTERDVSSYT